METHTVNEFSDANWFSLKRSIGEGNVIPIIGPDALMVDYENQTLPFYRLITSDLLRIFQIEPQPEILQHTWSLHKAVSIILANKGGQGIDQRIRREVSRLVAHYSNLVQPAESLRLLANLPIFTLFISLTPDNLLEQAMTDPHNIETTRVSIFSPRDASESLADLSLLRQGERGIFQMLGSCTNVGSGFAMHEEDALEYMFLLQSSAARRFASILSELRRRDKLFINCNFPDWLGRAIFRLVNDNRLYVKDTLEFLCPNAEDMGLHTFLTQYSPNTLGFEGQPEKLVKKLSQSFQAISSSTKPSVFPRRKSTGPGPTVFISYASENADSARRIAETLLNLGFSDVWLDKKKLIGGDDWSDRIFEAIEKTDFFIPILSKEADRRREGVFWDEWKTALEQARSIKDVFILPVGIDTEFPEKKAYSRISDGDTVTFFDKHLFHAPRGILSPEADEAFRERIRLFLEASHV
ncbi:hypothetical protein W03_05170 [Nitrosomonas sp. PY1]|uniref:toll/interleukin-1 receptor domain-containing protein n=1 Tax=Nitrosomonas sp. PY1 TaxID=1803906 RepID=UPI001FC7C90A|nr:toll/interleukin-1 receptor domain-containing protein [Nitrosomonas sp. PY1]GKS68513.1 hypothetical protein W03_05170 [Nitrosomonas sp. PY1]